MKRFLLIAVLCLISLPANAALYSVPDNGTVAVYGDFASAGGGVPGHSDGAIYASFTYQIIGGGFLQSYPYYDASTMEEITVSAHFNGTAGFTSYACNELEAHCGLANTGGNNQFAIFGIDGVGELEIDSFVSVTGGAIAPTLELFIDLPDGFSLTAPAVPEVSTWLMLLLGFAGIGLLSHRRLVVERLHRLEARAGL